MSFIVAGCVLLLALLVDIVLDDKKESSAAQGRRQAERLRTP
jgi:hypothetical protein